MNEFIWSHTYYSNIPTASTSRLESSRSAEQQSRSRSNGKRRRHNESGDESAGRELIQIDPEADISNLRLRHRLWWTHQEESLRAEMESCLGDLARLRSVLDNQLESILDLDIVIKAVEGAEGHH